MFLMKNAFQGVFRKVKIIMVFKIVLKRLLQNGVLERVYQKDAQTSFRN